MSLPIQLEEVYNSTRALRASEGKGNEMATAGAIVSLGNAAANFDAAEPSAVRHTPSG
jgi:hypothetical protein